MKCIHLPNAVLVCMFLPQYMGKVEPWCKACGEGELPSELQDLEDTIHHHQGLYEHITTAYSEVSTHIHIRIYNVCTHACMHAQRLKCITNVFENIDVCTAENKTGLRVVNSIKYSLKYPYMHFFT